MEPKASWASAPVGGLSVLGNGPQLVESLTKRELFAALAMQAILMGVERPDFDNIAELAGEAADALLAELAKGGAS